MQIHLYLYVLHCISIEQIYRKNYHLLAKSKKPFKETKNPITMLVYSIGKYEIHSFII